MRGTAAKAPCTGGTVQGTAEEGQCGKGEVQRRGSAAKVKCRGGAVHRMRRAEEGSGQRKRERGSAEKAQCRGMTVQGKHRAKGAMNGNAEGILHIDRVTLEQTQSHWTLCCAVQCGVAVRIAICS